MKKAARRAPAGTGPMGAAFYVALIWTEPMHKPRPLVFKCPFTRINVITDFSIRDGDERFVAEGIFMVDCPCCERQHHFCGYQSRNLRRLYARNKRASL